jgi:hypothetical protein
MWKFFTDLELWWIDVQLGDFHPPVLLGIAFLLAFVVVGYLGLRIAFWRSRADFATQLLSSTNLIFPAPVVKLKAVLLGALLITLVWFLSK